MKRRRNSDLHVLLISVFLFSFFFSFTLAFQSDELQDDDEFGLIGRKSPSDADGENSDPKAYVRNLPPGSESSSSSSSDSKVQFSLEHAFGESDGDDFSPAGTFTARLKTVHHGGQTLTKLRFSRNGFADIERKKFEKLLKDDGFYRIRLPSNVLSPPGREYVTSSVKARCLPRGSLDEHFVIQMEGVNILAVNYGSTGTCQYPRPLKFPTKWSFNSYTILKNSEQVPRLQPIWQSQSKHYLANQKALWRHISASPTSSLFLFGLFINARVLVACRAPAFIEDLGGGNGDGEGTMPPERSFWSKYWMYMIPLGLIVMNAITQAMNMPEEQGAGQQPVAQRPQNPAVRRR